MAIAPAFTPGNGNTIQRPRATRYDTTSRSLVIVAVPAADCSPRAPYTSTAAPRSPVNHDLCDVKRPSVHAVTCPVAVRLEVIGDVLEDRADLRAEQDQRADDDDGDQRDDQCILDQSLSRASESHASTC